MTLDEFKSLKKGDVLRRVAAHSSELMRGDAAVVVEWEDSVTVHLRGLRTGVEFFSDIEYAHNWEKLDDRS